MEKTHLISLIKETQGSMSRTVAIRKFRVYVKQCPDMEGFRELKVIIFKLFPLREPSKSPAPRVKPKKQVGKKHYYQDSDGKWKKRGAKIPYKTGVKHSTREVKLWRWVEIKNGILIIHNTEWKNVPKRSRKLYIAERGNVVRLFDKERVGRDNAGLTTRWADRKIEIQHKKQSLPKEIKTVVKIIHLSLPEATCYDTEFIKGKGRVLTELGETQKRFSYYYKAKPTRGRDRIVKRAHGLHLKETTIINHNIVKDRVMIKVPVPKPNIRKQELKVEARMEKEKNRNHITMLKLNTKHAKQHHQTLKKKLKEQKDGENTENIHS